jgi:UDPglucose 6-dehydrogenase
LAELGHEVLAVDIDHAKVAKAASGEPPFFEPGLEPLLRKNLEAGHAAVLGIAFKPGSDDVRDSPSLAVCDQLASEGAIVRVHDPVATGNAAIVRPDLRYADTVTEASSGADVVLHLTEWADYRAIDPVALGRVVSRRNIVDGRCALDADYWRSAGWTVRTLGRP